MRLKNKAVGLLAAAALTLGLVAAAGADTASDSATATLTGGPCTVAANAADFNFGAWDYDGEGYDGQPVSKSVSWTVTAGDPAGCNVTLQFGGLTNTDPNYANHKIGLENFWGSLTAVGIPLGPIQLDNPGMKLGTGYSIASNPDVAAHLVSINPFGLPQFPSTTITGEFTLLTVPDNIMPGTYEGTINSTVTNGQ